MNFERTGEKKLNIVLLVACIMGAVLGWFGAELVYKILPSSFPVILQVGIYFAIVIFGITITAFVSELVVNRAKSSWTGSEIGRSVLFIIGGALLFVLLGMLFQFIYGLGYTNKHTGKIDDYMFVIDNSGSTDGSDPNDLRFGEVEGLVERLNNTNRFSVEVFDDRINGKIPLAEVNEASVKELKEFDNNMKSLEKGGTEIQLVLEDLINGYVPDGRSAAAILLSDGESNSPVDYESLSKAFSDKKVPIFCVAFSNMGRNGVKTMTMLAENTDGYYCEIDDLKDLDVTLDNMIKLTSRRTLIERRRGSDVSNILALILRVLFITILGILVDIVLTLVLDYEELLRTTLLIHIPFSILAGLVAEIVMRFLANSSITRLLMDILMAIIVASYTKYSYSLGNDWDMDINWDSTPSLQARKPKTKSDLNKKRAHSHDNSSLL